MATGSLAIELEATSLQLPNNLSIPKPREAAHSCGDYDSVVPPVVGSRKDLVTPPRSRAGALDQFPSKDVASDVRRLGDGSALGYEAGKFVRGRKEKALGQFLDLYPNRQFHTS